MSSIRPPTDLVGSGDPAPEAAKAPKQVLIIVEDERFVASDVQALEDLGFAVVGTVPSAAHARRVKEERPNLILMDSRVDTLDVGLRAAAIRRAGDQLSVVHRTANASGRAIEAEASGFLLKPYTARTLHTTVQLAQRRRESNGAPV